MYAYTYAYAHAAAACVYAQTHVSDVADAYVSGHGVTTADVVGCAAMMRICRFVVMPIIL